MRVYEIDIWRSVYHGDKFSHTTTRLELVHALNEERAKKKITLDGEKTWGQEARASSETIYRIKKTGTVTIKPYYVYSDGRSPRPVRV